jgi:hypothetical protein
LSPAGTFKVTAAPQSLQNFIERVLDRSGANYNTLSGASFSLRRHLLCD